MYYIGIDGGGTKTKFTLVNDSLEVISEVTEGTCHHNQIGFENVEILLREGTNKLIKKANLNPKDISHLHIGIAGYGRVKSIVDKLDETAQKAFEGFEYSIGNDVQIALYGSLDGNEGINVIAGTGSISLALDKNKELHRCGGWGYRLGDEGSAYWIGNQVLNEFTKQSDGRKEKTILYNKIKETLEIDNDHDIIKYVNETINGDRTEIAKYSILCSEVARENDTVAQNIFKNAGEELASLISALDKHFDKDRVINVSYAGGVFKSEELIIDPIKNNLDSKRFNVISPIYSPDIGACIIAKEKYYERTKMN